MKQVYIQTDVAVGPYCDGAWDWIDYHWWNPIHWFKEKRQNVEGTHDK